MGEGPFLLGAWYGYCSIASRRESADCWLLMEADLILSCDGARLNVLSSSKGAGPARELDDGALLWSDLEDPPDGRRPFEAIGAPCGIGGGGGVCLACVSTGVLRPERPSLDFIGLIVFGDGGPMAFESSALCPRYCGPPRGLLSDSADGTFRGVDDCCADDSEGGTLATGEAAVFGLLAASSSFCLTITAAPPGPSSASSSVLAKPINSGIFPPVYFLYILTREETKKSFSLAEFACQ